LRGWPLGGFEILLLFILIIRIFGFFKYMIRDLIYEFMDKGDNLA
jgi:hypothetical protein